MQEDIQTQVLGVRSEPSKDGQSIKHLVSITGGQAASGTQYPAGEYTTFSPELLAKAQGHVNTGLVKARVAIVQKPKQRGGGVWINHNLEDIGNDIPPLAMPTQAGTPVTAQPPAQPTASQPPQPQTHPVLAQADERRSEENRRSAIHAAAEVVVAEIQTGFVTNSAEASASFRQRTEANTAYIETGSFNGHEEQKANPMQTLPPGTMIQTTAEEIAAGVPGVQAGVAAVQPPFDAQPAA